MRPAFCSLLGIALSTLSANGGGAQTLSCHSAQQPKQIAELLFGRDIGHRVGVSELAWQRFVTLEIAPRFPDGFIVTDAVGQWRDRASGATVHEPAKHVEIVLPGADDDEAKLDAIVSAYKHEFRQDSVGVIQRAACVSF